MQARQSLFDVAPSSLLPPRVGRLVRPFDPFLSRLFVPGQLLRGIPESADAGLSPLRFAGEILRNLSITYSVSDADRGRIPAHGPALVVANHPFGFLEGLLLLDLLEKIRPDYRIIANELLSGFPPLRERVIFVDAFEERLARHANGTRLRASLAWLRGGGLLVTFPAGAVSHLDWRERSVVDPRWNTAAARLVRKTGCPAIPLYFDGANSPRFQMAGTIHPRLRTLNLLNELANKRSSQITVRIGTPVPASTVRGFGDAEAATEYLRARTYLLSYRSAATGQLMRRVAALAKKEIPVAPQPATTTEAELLKLPAEQTLLTSGDFSVFLARAHQVPSVLQEIGRCREIAYRAVGEGTGRRCDLDDFDKYYEHIVLWNRADRTIAGAYRLAATTDVLRTRGIEGLYSSTLFHYQPAFFEHIGPALELGRSFVCLEYQKQYSPLLLLWKGILAYVERRPQCAVLFGAVSVSREYHALSRALIVNFLSGHVDGSAAWIRARRGLKRRLPLPKHVRQLGRLLPTVDELSASIGDLECDGKGLPVLMRQYLKVGGQLLGSNVDPNFSDVLDVLVMADLRRTSGPMLERCMGRAAAERFRAFHSHPVRHGMRSVE